jgi:glyoxylase-like metal-dependent hydrolase (beta-lactamase superfamily II)
MEESQTIQTFKTASGHQIFQIPVQAFPGLWANVYLVLAGQYWVLIDSGSGFGDSNEHLLTGFDQVGSLLHRSKFEMAELTHVFITHGHIDHFGGLNFVKEISPALIGIHELDRRNLTNHEERVAVVVKSLQHYLIEAGIRPERIDDLVSLYKLTKSLFHSIPVDFSYEGKGMSLGPFEFLHVPGHCAGHVLIRLEDILFVGDHILSEISPHQAPEQLTLSTGLGHYLESLRKVEPFSSGIRLALGGHQRPIVNIKERIEEIKRLHADRLNQILSFLETPCTIDEISKALFGEVQGYNTLLAIEETGAHVEYLYQHGMIGIHNLADYEQNNTSSPILYRRSETFRPEIVLGLI